MFGPNYKSWIRENVDLKVKEYLVWLDVKQCWDDIMIEYASTDNEKFMELSGNHRCKHPKRLYRPGNTVVCHFTPISENLVKQYHDGKMTKEAWEKLCLDTRQISRGITDAVVETLQDFGREVALLSERDGWSHACGAEVAGMGTFEYKEDMFCSETKIGYLGSVITEVIID